MKKKKRKANILDYCLILLACGIVANGFFATRTEANATNVEISSETESVSTEESTIDATMEWIGGDELGDYNRISYYRNTITDIIYMYYSENGNFTLVEMSNPQTGKPLTYKMYETFID